jgi:hypothetical protein
VTLSVPISNASSKKFLEQSSSSLTDEVGTGQLLVNVEVNVNSDDAGACASCELFNEVEENNRGS